MDFKNKVAVVTGAGGTLCSCLAIELAKKYDDEKTYGFVNGVLNAVAKELGKK